MPISHLTRINSRQSIFTEKEKDLRQGVPGFARPFRSALGKRTFLSYAISKLKGNGIDSNTEFWYEKGPDNWKVRCECGAADDDGERMIACNTSEVRQHTRCNGIGDSETVPTLLVCTKCNAVIL